ncbi:TraR/DksA C4-type zinc finger protein [Natronospora cellulosivora (SeqCode)]
MIFFFHTCINCGKPINPERLQVLPETKICIRCAEICGSDLVITRAEVGMDKETYRDLIGAIRS